VKSLTLHAVTGDGCKCSYLILHISNSCSVQYLDAILVYMVVCQLASRRPSCFTEMDVKVL